MSLVTRSAVAGLLLAAGGCEQGRPPDQARAPTKITNPYHDQLSGLPADLQRLGLMRAIRDNGRRCQRVEAAAYQEDYRQMAMWVALCADGRHWAVYIAPNGDTQVRDCADARQLNLPQCRPVSGSGTTDTR